MQKKLTAVLIVLVLSAALIGCDTDIGPEKDGSGDTYSTQQRNSSIEYSIYMNKQIVVFANQLNARVTAVNNMKKSYYSDEAEMAKQSLKTLKETRDEVDVTYPSVGQDENRLTTLKAMDTTLHDFEEYIKALEAGNDVSGYIDIFMNDYNQLTGLANLYNQ